VRFSRQLGQAVADLEVSAAPEVVCQRCMQTMRWPVQVKSRIALVSDYNAADRVPEGLEVFLVEADSVSVRDLVMRKFCWRCRMWRAMRKEASVRTAGLRCRRSGRRARGGRAPSSKTVCTVGRTVETQVVVA
jgi:ribosomal protein S13